MLRCSTSIFTIAICFVCAPTLFGQGFPSQLNDALQTKADQSVTSTTVKKQIHQRPWLGDTTPATKTSFGPKEKQEGLNGRPQASNKPSFDIESVKGTRFKPTPSYMKYKPTQPNSEMLEPYSLTTTPDSSFTPKPSFVPQPRLTPTDSASPHKARVETKSDAVTATPASQKKVSIDLPSQETSLNPQPNLSEIAPAIRREIEEQVRQDLEAKFDSRIQSLVKQQVREQVREARYKMERAARSNRVATRPILSSTYRVPATRREAPTVTGEVLPLIVAGDSQKPEPPTNPARYLLTDTVPSPEVESNVESNVYTPPRNSMPTTNRREPQAEQDQLRDAAQSQLKSDAEAILTAKESESPAEAPEFARTESALAENPATENSTNETSATENSEQLQEFYLRTSVIGPGTLLKDVSDSYAIMISNITNQPATNVIVQLTVPEAITISKLDRDAYLDQKLRTVSWKVASIGPGQQEVIKYRAVSSSTGTYKQEVRLGMENTFQGKTPFETIVQSGAPELPVATKTKEDYLEVAERLDFDE